MSDLARAVQSAAEAAEAIAAFAADADEMRASIKEVGRLLRQALDDHETEQEPSTSG